jgi:trimeric autotransporter adhesin
MPEQMKRTRGIRTPAWLCGLAMLLAATAAWATEYHGQVFVNGVPVPGATVTVTQDGQQLSTVTDEQGVYEFPNLQDGAWKIEIRMRGFETLRSEVTIRPDLPQGKFELTLLGLESMLAHNAGGTGQSAVGEPRRARKKA